MGVLEVERALEKEIGRKFFSFVSLTQWVVIKKNDVEVGKGAYYVFYIDI